ncbi:hypothetical protein HMPREF1556_00619 [Porphyromonas sp. oral taxon 278 str. W7784]|nr:hypothetical protein HMPREF1556_00619 [Porphyromonas sp. oral taxon 278 str. W7784]
MGFRGVAQKGSKKTYCRSPDRPTVGRITTYSVVFSATYRGSFFTPPKRPY